LVVSFDEFGYNVSLKANRTLTPNTRLAARQAVRTSDLSEDAVRLDVSQFDPVTQVITSQHMLLSEEGIRLYPVKIRYVWPSELDLMAQLAGLELRHRWANWRKEPFTSSSTAHVSVYGHSRA